jgi:hypothetical protein
MRPAVFLFCTISVVGGAIASARAAEPSPTAEALYRQGKQAMERGDYAAACAQLSESQRLQAAPGTLLNLATCEERSGKPAAALGHYRQARGLLRDGDYRIPFAEQRAAELARRVPRLRLALAGAQDAVVVLDGADVPPAALGIAVPVEPGTHACIVRASGRAEQRVDLVLAEGEERTIELAPGAPLARGDRHDGDAHGDRTSTSAQKIAGLAIAGAGVAGLTVGAVFGLMAKSTYDGARAGCPSGPGPCDGQAVHDGATAQTQATVSTVAFVAGGALLAGGAVLFFTAPNDRRVVVGSFVGPNASGLRIGGAW